VGIPESTKSASVGFARVYRRGMGGGPGKKELQIAYFPTERLKPKLQAERIFLL
jgi:hypothetical protein